MLTEPMKTVSHFLVALAVMLFVSLPSTLLAQEAQRPDPILKDKLELGKKVYFKRCVWCHGVEGGGDGPSADRLFTRPRNFIQGTFKIRWTDSGELPLDRNLIDTVKIMDADLGVAFDGDADRLGVVTPSGEIIFADRTMMLFIREICGRNPGARIIYDVKCTGKLDAIIREAGGEPESIGVRLFV